MKIQAPPRVSDHPFLDMWLRELFHQITVLPGELVWERAGTIISPVAAGDTLDMGTGDINATEGILDVLTATSGSIGSMGVTAGGVITGASVSADQISAGNLNVGAGSITTTSQLNSATAAISGNLMVGGDSDLKDVNCQDITCIDIDANDIICTSLTI